MSFPQAAPVPAPRPAEVRRLVGERSDAASQAKRDADIEQGLGYIYANALSASARFPTSPNALKYGKGLPPKEIAPKTNPESSKPEDQVYAVLHGCVIARSPYPMGPIGADANPSLLFCVRDITKPDLWEEFKKAASTLAKSDKLQATIRGEGPVPSPGLGGSSAYIRDDREAQKRRRKLKKDIKQYRGVVGGVRARTGKRKRSAFEAGNALDKPREKPPNKSASRIICDTLNEGKQDCRRIVWTDLISATRTDCLYFLRGTLPSYSPFVHYTLLVRNSTVVRVLGAFPLLGSLRVDQVKKIAHGLLPKNIAESVMNMCVTRADAPVATGEGEEERKEEVEEGPMRSPLVDARKTCEMAESSISAHGSSAAAWFLACAHATPKQLCAWNVLSRNLKDWARESPENHVDAFRTWCTRVADAFPSAMQVVQWLCCKTEYLHVTTSGTISPVISGRELAMARPPIFGKELTDALVEVANAHQKFVNFRNQGILCTGGKLEISNYLVLGASLGTIRVMRESDSRRGGLSRAKMCFDIDAWAAHDMAMALFARPRPVMTYLVNCPTFQACFAAMKAWAVGSDRLSPTDWWIPARIDSDIGCGFRPGAHKLFVLCATAAQADDVREWMADTDIEGIATCPSMIGRLEDSSMDGFRYAAVLAADHVSLIPLSDLLCRLQRVVDGRVHGGLHSVLVFGCTDSRSPHRISGGAPRALLQSVLELNEGAGAGRAMSYVRKGRSATELDTGIVCAKLKYDLAEDPNAAGAGETPLLGVIRTKPGQALAAAISEWGPQTPGSPYMPPLLFPARYPTEDGSRVSDMAEDAQESVHQMLDAARGMIYTSPGAGFWNTERVEDALRFVALVFGAEMTAQMGGDMLWKCPPGFVCCTGGEEHRAYLQSVIDAELGRIDEPIRAGVKRPERGFYPGDVVWSEARSQFGLVTECSAEDRHGGRRIREGVKPQDKNSKLCVKWFCSESSAVERVTNLYGLALANIISPRMTHVCPFPFLFFLCAAPDAEIDDGVSRAPASRDEMLNALASDAKACVFVGTREAVMACQQSRYSSGSKPEAICYWTQAFLTDSRAPHKTSWEIANSPAQALLSKISSLPAVIEHIKSIRDEEGRA